MEIKPALPARIDSASDFQPYQIVCLEHEGSCLYAEVIQIVTYRRMFWVRPLMLAVWPPDEIFQTSPPSLYDLREGADLVWPMNLFQLAVDSEMIPLLAQLEAAAQDQPPDAPITAHRHLRDFVHRVWQACPNEFSDL